MTTQRSSLAQWVRNITIEHVPDSELLKRFVEVHDQTAFELLVHRHGPMVLGLCRRFLGQMSDAEDAFQATFLSLAHQARTIRKQTALGSWLYQVAWRMCRRQHRRRPVSQLDHEPATDDASAAHKAEQREVAELLAKEVDRLTQSLRSVVVLCCLRGLSPKEAAIELACPANTVVVRLRRARELLRQRLKARGYVLSVGIAGTLGISTSSAHVSTLAISLSQTALQVTSQGLSSGLLSPTVACLMKGALLTMWLKPIQLTTLAVMSLGLITIPLWNGGTPVQAQQGERVLIHRSTPYISAQFYERLSTAPATNTTYPPDENLPDEARKWIDEQQKQEEVIRKEAEQKMRGMRVALHGKLKQLQETYTKAGDLDRALALREQARRLELTILQAVSYDSNPSIITQHRGQQDKSLIVQVRGRTNGSVWGDGIYTDDSDLATVAVHAGLLQPGQTGMLKVTIMPGRDNYTGSTKHGVTSSVFQNYPGSMRVEKAEMLSESK